MKRIDDIVATLSPEERERFSGLITECKEREDAIKADSARARTALEQSVQAQIGFNEGLEEIGKSLEELNKNLGSVLLNMIPTDQCHKA